MFAAATGVSHETLATSIFNHNLKKKKMTNKILVICSLLIILGCNKQKSEKQISKRQIQIEENLIALKNWCFIECYSESQKLTYKRIGINTKDSCFSSKQINDLTKYYYVNNSGIDLNIIFKDSNRVRLIEKWVNKEGYVPFVNPPDFPQGSLDMVKALDFYNSEDLKKYIDSIRKIELKKINTSS